MKRRLLTNVVGNLLLFYCSCVSFSFLVQQPFQQQLRRFLFSSSTIISSGTLRTTCPLRNNSPSPRAPAIPISASRASPGPFTAQPSTATLIGTCSVEIYSSTSLAILIKSISIRPQVGQEISVAALDARPNDFNSSRATFTSSTGSALNEIRSVFPMPLLKIAPRPAALLQFRQITFQIL